MQGNTICVVEACNNTSHIGSSHFPQHLGEMGHGYHAEQKNVDFDALRVKFQAAAGRRWVPNRQYDDLVQTRVAEIQAGSRSSSHLVVLDDEFSPRTHGLFAIIDRVFGKALINTRVKYSQGKQTKQSAGPSQSLSSQLLGPMKTAVDNQFRWKHGSHSGTSTLGCMDVDQVAAVLRQANINSLNSRYL